MEFLTTDNFSIYELFEIVKKIEEHVDSIEFTKAMADYANSIIKKEKQNIVLDNLLCERSQPDYEEDIPF